MIEKYIATEIKNTCTDIQRISFVIVPDNNVPIPDIIVEVIKAVLQIIYLIFLLIALTNEQRLLSYNPQLLLPSPKKQII